MEMAAALGVAELPACLVFAPEDEVAVEYYLIPRLRWTASSLRTTR